MKKIITFTEDQIQQIVWLLNGVSVTGIQNSRQIAAVAQILDSGTPGEIKEPEQSRSHFDYSPVDWSKMPDEKSPISNAGKKKEGAS